MDLRRKISILVLLVGLILLGMSLAQGELPDYTTLKSSGVITAVLLVVVTAFHHYGWRCPGLSLLTTTPNLRGTWRFTNARVASVSNSNLSHQAQLTSGYVVIRQSETHIAARILWDGDAPSSPRLSPTAVNEDKMSFTGTFLEYGGETPVEHAYVTFITFEDKCPSQFTIRYRTDHDVTGSLTATGRKLAVVATAADAKALMGKKVRWWQRLAFALTWT